MKGSGLTVPSLWLSLKKVRTCVTYMCVLVHTVWVCVSLFLYSDNRHPPLCPEGGREIGERWDEAEKKGWTGYKDGAEGGWTTAEIRKCSRFLPGHNQYHHQISLPLIRDASVVFGKADFSSPGRPSSVMFHDAAAGFVRCWGLSLSYIIFRLMGCPVSVKTGHIEH